MRQATDEYGYDGNDAIQLERKYDVKLRGLPAPDDAEALALTFAYPVRIRPPQPWRRKN